MIKMHAIKIRTSYQFDEIVATNEPLIFIASGTDNNEKFFSLLSVKNSKFKMYFLFGVKCDVLRCAEIVGNSLVINEKMYSCVTDLLIGDNYTWRCLKYENDVNFQPFGHVANELHYFQRDDTLIVNGKKYFFPLTRLFTAVQVPRGILFIGEHTVKNKNDFLISENFLSVYNANCRINDYNVSRNEMITTRSIQFFLCLNEQILLTRPIDIAGIPITIYYTSRLHLILLCANKILTIDYRLEDLEFFHHVEAQC